MNNSALPKASAQSGELFVSAVPRERRPRAKPSDEKRSAERKSFSATCSSPCVMGLSEIRASAPAAHFHRLRCRRSCPFENLKAVPSSQPGSYPHLTRWRSCCIKESKGELCGRKRENELDWPASAGVAGR